MAAKIFTLAARQIKAISVDTGIDHNLIVLRYGLERLLFRLSQTPYKDDFALKGAMLFTLWTLKQHRATRDMDFSTGKEASKVYFQKVFIEACEIEVPDDAMTFDTASIKVRDIRVENVFGGVRVELYGKFGPSQRLGLQIDIGFGDDVLPRPLDEAYLGILHDKLPTTVLKMYPKEAVIAEKLHAMISKGQDNSRMKDFFDIWYLCRHFEFDGAMLSRAIKAAFARNKLTAFDVPPVCLTEAFANDPLKLIQWKNFLDRSYANPRETFPVVVGDIMPFLLPLVQAQANDSEHLQIWSPQKLWADAA